MLDLLTAVADLKADLVHQLYDEWRGYYLLRRQVDGQCLDVRPLSRAEALTYRCAPDESLRLVYDPDAALQAIRARRAAKP